MLTRLGDRRMYESPLTGSHECSRISERRGQCKREVVKASFVAVTVPFQPPPFVSAPLFPELLPSSSAMP